MKRIAFTVLFVMLPFVLITAKTTPVTVKPAVLDRPDGIKINGFPFYIYQDGFAGVNHYVPSGWMGDYGDIRMKESWKENPKSGKSCIQITYNASNSQGASWAGIYWQNPPNNWGGLRGGFNLSGAKRLFFYAKGETGDEYVEFKMGGIVGRYPDSSAGNRTDALRLNRDWTLYAIDLEGMDLSYISGGFCVAFNTMLNPQGCTFYLDEIYYADKNMPLELEEMIARDSEKLDKSTVITINLNSVGLSYSKNLLKIAVLPFENTSRSRDLEYLSKTISESISTSLGREKKLRVLDLDTINKRLRLLNMSVDDFDVLNGDLILGKILDVDTIIRGSFVEVNNKILINTKLVDIKTGTIITSDQVQGDLRKDVFLLMDKTSQSLLNQIATMSKPVVQNTQTYTPKPAQP